MSHLTPEIYNWEHAHAFNRRKIKALDIYLQPLPGEDAAMDNGGLYIFYNKQEKEYLYVGKSNGNIPDTVARHFHRYIPKKPLEIVKHRCEQHPNWSSWIVYLLPAEYCEPFVEKAFFWNLDEYESHWSKVEESFKEWKSDHRDWFIDCAETALITITTPRYNFSKNVLQNINRRRR